MQAVAELTKNEVKQGISNMTATVEIIYPEQAEKYLSGHFNIRKLMPTRIERYSKDLISGSWDQNGESIKFDEFGNLIDGQHRLISCFKTGIAFISVVVRGIKPDAFFNIDRGGNRTFALQLERLGETNVTQLGAVLVMLWKHNTQGYIYKGGGKHPSDSELLKQLEENPGVRNSMFKIKKASKIFTNYTLLCALHYIFSVNSDTDFADEFFEPLISGSNLTEVDARFHLRNRLINDKLSKTKLLQLEVAALVIKSWNYFVEQRPVKKLAWTSVGNTPEPFPEILSIK